METPNKFVDSKIKEFLEDHMNRAIMMHQTLPTILNNHPGKTICYSTSLGFAWMVPNSETDN